MQLTFRNDLAFVTATLTNGGASVNIADVLVDTGAASTIINADYAAEVGVFAGATDTIRRLRGVGGHEHVFTRHVDRFAVGRHGFDQFELDLGEMDYGFRIGGILGMDFLRAAGAVIDLDRREINFSAALRMGLRGAGVRHYFYDRPRLARDQFQRCLEDGTARCWGQALLLQLRNRLEPLWGSGTTSTTS